MTQPLPSETIEYERHVDGLRQRHAELLKAFRDYFSVPVLSDPRHEAEFIRATRNAHEILSRAEGIVPSPTPEGRAITIHLEGGLVQDVTGIPPGVEVHVADYDRHDETHPSWNSEYECHVTVYGGDGV